MALYKRVVVHTPACRGRVDACRRRAHACRGLYARVSWDRSPRAAGVSMSTRSRHAVAERAIAGGRCVSPACRRRHAYDTLIFLKILILFLIRAIKAAIFDNFVRWCVANRLSSPWSSQNDLRSFLDNFYKILGVLKLN